MVLIRKSLCLLQVVSGSGGFNLRLSQGGLGSHTGLTPVQSLSLHLSRHIRSEKGFSPLNPVLSSRVRSYGPNNTPSSRTPPLSPQWLERRASPTLCSDPSEVKQSSHSVNVQEHRLCLSLLLVVHSEEWEGDLLAGGAIHKHLHRGSRAGGVGARSVGVLSPVLSPKLSSLSSSSSLSPRLSPGHLYWNRSL